jgi:hypothetical protein
MTNGNNGEVGGFGKRCTSSVTRSDKRQARPHTDHFKSLLEEASPNHAYLIRHKLKDCGMMRSFMTSGSHAWGAELNEGPHGSDMMPFPEENTALIVYGGCPPPPPEGGAACLTQAPGPQRIAVGDMGTQGCNIMSFSHIL